MTSVLAGVNYVLGVFAWGITPRKQYHAKPVRIIAPFALGGGSEFSSSFVAHKFRERLGQQSIVDAGAGGNLGTKQAIKSAPDGYTRS